MATKNVRSASDASLVVTVSIDENLRDGLALLWQSYTYAQNARADVWDFALEIDRLYEASLTISDLRWLIAKGLAQHGLETSVYGDSHRSFRPNGGLNFLPATCFVLTPKGAKFAKSVLNDSLDSEESNLTHDMEFGSAEGVATDLDSHGPAAKTSDPQAGLKPHWDPKRRELRFGDKIVKHFRVPALNQETILSAFEEEGWPAYMDDPLPGSGDVVPKHRLHNTINRLNGNQTNRLIQFHGNGNGKGIGWKLADD